MKKTVLVIGSGGREHAIVDALYASKEVGTIYAAPGNALMAKEATLVPISVLENGKLLAFALEHKVDLTVVGPEASLATGIVDLFKEHGLEIFGPTKSAARIETSKEFAKELMEKYAIPTASYKVFSDYEEAKEYVLKHGAPIVIKYDGLAAGKGVTVALTLEEALASLKEQLLDHKFGEGKIILEDYLEGPEFSFLCFVNGEHVYPLELSQDHKRAFDHDEGLNTGGMGAYSPLPFLSAEDKKYALENIMVRTAKAMVKEGCPFTGVLYGGLMKTKDGIKVIEFNCRFGDPETEVVLPRLESDLFLAFEAVLHNEEPVLKFSSSTTLGIVLASKGYPLSYKKHFLIEGLENVEGKVYGMGVEEKDGKIFTAGGRVLIVVEKGKDVREAREKALREVEKIHCDNLFYRHDIGHWALEGEKK